MLCSHLTASGVSDSNRASTMRAGAIAALGKLGLVLLGIALAAGSLELITRWRFGRPLSLQGEWLDLTKIGFRYGTYRMAKDPLTIRVVGIGDSFAYGVVQPTYNYHHLMERLLTRRLGRPVEVINLGWPAAGPAKELAVLRDLGLRLDPDVVVWSFFVGNDFTDDRRPSAYELEEVLRRRHWEKAVRTDIKLPWYEKFRLTGYVRFVLAYIKNVGVTGPSREGRDTFSPEAFLELESQRMAMVLNDRGIKLAFRRVVAPLLEEAIGICREREVPFVLVIVPDEALVESDLGRQVLINLRGAGKLEPKDRNRYDEAQRTGNLRPLTVAHSLLAELDALDGVWVIDLGDEFREAGANGGLYLERDTHWNRHGNELAAKLIADIVQVVVSATG